jgi:cation:H+ antiporter
MVAYSLAFVAGVIGTQDWADLRFINFGIAGVLLLAYAFYVRRTIKDTCAVQESSCPMLYTSRICKIPPTRGKLGFALIVFQVAAALLLIIIGAKFFVEEVETVSTSVGIPVMILAFLIAPIATELPEKFNSVIWYLRSKDTLAFGNITGAMVFQSSIPVSIGLLFTHWELQPINIASIVIALAAAGWMYYNVRVHKRITYRTMLLSGSLYVLYIILLVLFPGSAS